jgi:hypothetical protein
MKVIVKAEEKIKEIENDTTEKKKTKKIKNV